MSNQRIKSLKKVMDRALRQITGKVKFCWPRVYEKLGIPTLNVVAATNRVRDFNKWISSHGLIKDLIALQNVASRFKKGTWVTGTCRWPTRHCRFEEGKWHTDHKIFRTLSGPHSCAERRPDPKGVKIVV